MRHLDNVLFHEESVPQKRERRSPLSNLMMSRSQTRVVWRIAVGFTAVALFITSQSILAAAREKASLKAVTQQFQQATAEVIASAREYFAKMNLVEQNGTIDELAFEGKPINNVVIDQIQIISPQELQVRIEAMNAVSQYTVDLANLAAGTSLKTFGTNLRDLSKNLKQCSTDAGSLPGVSSGSVLKNKEFPGIVGGAVTAIGAIIALIEGRRAQNEIRRQIVQQDGPLTTIITTIGDEMQLAYERQRNKHSARERNLTIVYNNGVSGPSPNVFMAILLAHQIEASRQQMTALSDSSPAKAVAAMAKAHTAMVQYVTSGKKGADLAPLVASVGSFFSTAQSAHAAPETGATAVRVK
jgi:hypothetical protein